jgi:hypothetical protein
MLARRAAWIALIYTIDDDPVLENAKAVVMAEPSGRVVLKVFIRAPTTGLSGLTVVWQRNSAGGSGDQWVAALLTTGYSDAYDTSKGVATYTIESMTTPDFILYRIYVTGGEKDPATSVPVDLHNVTDWGT